MRSPQLDDLPRPPGGKTGFPWTQAAPPASEGQPLGVSVVSPSYNQAEFLEESIRSVLLQGYPALEYIIVDGGSTDGSIEIIRKYEPWLAYWVSEPDAGQADAINKGWGRCTGDIVAWLNSDDYYLPGTLSAVASRFAADPQVGLVYGDIQVLDQRGRLSGALGYGTGESDMLARMTVPYQPASFFRRAAVSRVGALDPSLRYVMDVDILLRVMANISFAYIAQPLAVFRIHAASKTHLAEAGFANELLSLLRRVERDFAQYPVLERVGIARTRQNLYALAAKHFYQGNRFRESLRCIALACRANPLSAPGVLGDVGSGWVARRFLPIEQYRSLAHRWRSRPR